MDWLSKINPDTVIGVLSLFGTVGGWLWHKARGKKKESVNSIVDSVINNLVHELLDSYVPSNGDVTEYLKKARKYIDERVWPVLAKRGVPKNAVTIRLFHEAIERCTAWLASEVREMRLRSAHGPVL